MTMQINQRLNPANPILEIYLMVPIETKFGSLSVLYCKHTRLLLRLPVAQSLPATALLRYKPLDWVWGTLDEGNFCLFGGMHVHTVFWIRCVRCRGYPHSDPGHGPSQQWLGFS